MCTHHDQKRATATWLAALAAADGDEALACELIRDPFLRAEFARLMAASDVSLSDILRRRQGSSRR